MRYHKIVNFEKLDTMCTGNKKKIPRNVVFSDILNVINQSE